ncbi:MAG: hypothetical protein KAT74_12325 [Candidatus Cloacimonetes bacterium]|nr:hypothetical protein [Candidatus Cloacimonadota bacterium]
MKRITIVMIVIGLWVAFALLADTVTFSLQPDAGASNIQGKVYVWDDQLNEFVLVGPGEQVHVFLYRNNNAPFGDKVVYTNDFSFYQHNFEDPNGNSGYCNLVKVKFQGVTYQEYYDGIVRIDIYWTQIPPPEQTPEEE